MKIKGKRISTFVISGLALAFALSVAAAACGGDDAQLAPVPGLTAAVLQNATYPSEFTESGEVQLAAGAFSGPAGEDGTAITVTFGAEMALGDLDGDGVDDAAVTLATNTGGSGTFIELVAVLYDDGVAVPVASESLGDRVGISSLAIVDGRIELDAIVHREDDPLCCPTLAVSRDYALEGSALVLVDEVEFP